jgi:hypothetical protein
MKPHHGPAGPGNAIPCHSPSMIRNRSRRIRVVDVEGQAIWTPAHQPPRIRAVHSVSVAYAYQKNRRGSQASAANPHLVAAQETASAEHQTTARSTEAVGEWRLRRRSRLRLPPLFGPTSTPVIFVRGPRDHGPCSWEGAQPLCDCAHLRCALAPVLRVIHDPTVPLCVHRYSRRNAYPPLVQAATVPKQTRFSVALVRRNLRPSTQGGTRAQGDTVCMLDPSRAERLLMHWSALHPSATPRLLIAPRLPTNGHAVPSGPIWVYEIKALIHR